MKQILIFLFFIFSLTMQSQCFDCAKSFGGLNDDTTADLKKASNGIYFAKNGGSIGDRMSIYKYDFNCNLIWKKEIDESALYINKLVIDSQDNIYVLFTWHDAHNAVGPFPQSFSGVPMYPGLNLIKFDKNGNFVWNQSIGNIGDYGMRDIYIHDDIIYVVGTLHPGMPNQTTLTYGTFNQVYNASPNQVLFIAKFDINGNLEDASIYGTDNDDYTSSEMDEEGNLYFSRYLNSNSNYTHSDIDKIDKNLNFVWTKEISNNKTKNESSYIPTLLHYNTNNNKLYLWGAFYKLADIFGTIYTDPSTGVLNQSILSEFNVSNGKLEIERVKQINNSSTLPIPGMNGYSAGNTAYLTEKDNELYIFSSFTGTMEFPNAIIKSRTYNGGGGTGDLHNNEELVLFKINLDTFNSEFLLKSSGTNYYSGGMSTDAANPILFNGNELYLTSSFQSSPLTINGSVINNNSGNNASDVMLYKYNLDASSTATGKIIVENTCFNTTTNFEVKGTFDSILWDFDDPNSMTNNSATINNPQHQFTAIGTYNISATAQCGTETQTIKKEITITNVPNNFTLDPIYSCETNAGSGYSNSFDTSNVNNTIIGNQTNLIIEFTNDNGISLPSPLPNPYTNTIKNEETIKVKTYFANNPQCFVEKNLKLYTKNKPAKLNTITPQSFCIQQNKTLNDITITGQNLIWYDAPSIGNVLANTTILESKTYYVTQTNNNCESEKLPIVIKIQDTQPPIADANQSFCIQQNATISKIKISGEDIKWYNLETVDSNSSESTLLENGKTYYATQTINNCESEMVQITIQILAATTSDCINYIDELPYPKFFTPNSDGYNDNWTIEFAYLAPNTGIKIFDRYGKLIKILNINQDWDGTYNGYNLPSSDYWFVVTRLNGAEFKSHFSLKR